MTVHPVRPMPRDSRGWIYCRKDDKTYCGRPAGGQKASFVRTYGLGGLEIEALAAAHGWHACARCLSLSQKEQP